LELRPSWMPTSLHFVGSIAATKFMRSPSKGPPEKAAESALPHQECTCQIKQ
jgi:hypothetical protein